MRNVAYLSNRDLLLAIHESKTSFCSFLDPEYSEYEAIVKSLDEITPELITEIRERRIEVAKAADRADQKARGVKKYNIKAGEVPEDNSAIVVRVMTVDHVPMNGAKRVRTNFPAFKHFLVEGDERIEVGRSHWTGGFSNGHFSLEGGQLTRRLCDMYFLLVDRISMRGNFRNYSYVDDMRGQAMMLLAQIGLQFDESKSSNPFAFFSTSVINAFIKVLNTEKKAQNIRDETLEMAGLMPSFRRQAENER